MTWILTQSGKKLDFDNIEAHEFDINDIAHALSMICRFNGHVKYFYSVAQHSVHVSKLVPQEHALAALLHDAAEAYIGDVSTPLKQLLPDYKTIENRLEHAIRRWFNVPGELSKEIKHADLVALATEKRDLLPYYPEAWPCLENISPVPGRICHLRGWILDGSIAADPEYAKDRFIVRFKELKGLKGLKGL